MQQIILASGSPRRNELLKKAGFTFRVIPANISEFPNKNLNINDQILEIAQKKCEAVLTKVQVSTQFPQIIIAADTEVVFQNQTLGKPKDHQTAYEMLKMLSGKSHQVITALYLIFLQDQSSEVKTQTHVEISKVTFKNLSEEEINIYVKSGDPLDKAGAYGIQGEAGKFVQNVEGSIDNIIGLPVNVLIKLLANWKIYAS